MKQISVYFNEPHSLQSLPPPQGCYTCRSHLLNGFQMTKGLSSPSNERGWPSAYTCIRNPSHFFHPWFPAAWEAESCSPQTQPVLGPPPRCPGSWWWQPAPVCSQPRRCGVFCGIFSFLCPLGCLFCSLGSLGVSLCFPYRCASGVTGQ